ncbi:hypothetical protein [Aliamphritea hakodatensis]|uniref:hypothetical protein n=1 Tax=Aliamphritea hakodatensis TaxID=2895352 RepID=UPI0022FD511D|nr:hypothetical protein [Aliamphritea hakodatensis]
MNGRFFAGLSALAALNALLPAALTAVYSQGLVQALAEGFGRSPVIWLSLLIAFLLCRKARQKGLTHQHASLNRSIADAGMAGLLTLMLLLPIALLSWLVCAAAATCWLRTSQQPYARAAAWLMISVAIREPVTQLLLNGFADQILGFDTWLSALFLPTGDQYSVSGNLINQANGFSLLILTGCSAFTNLSLALLLWLSVSLWYHQRLNKTDLLRAAVLCIAVLVINGVRLALMATGPELYAYIHDGDGMLIVDALLFITPVLCVRPARKTRAQHSPETHKPALTAINSVPMTIGLKAPALGLLTTALLIAPAIRITDINSTAATASVAASAPVAVQGLDGLPVRKLGELSPANRGNYRVSGFAHNICDGSIALLPLERNAEGAHILENMLSTQISGTGRQVTRGIIFAGQLYPEYPELTVLIRRVTFQVSSLFRSISRIFQPVGALPPSADIFPGPVAFVEFGQCRIADGIAANFATEQQLSYFAK